MVNPLAVNAGSSDSTTVWYDMNSYYSEAGNGDLQ